MRWLNNGVGRPIDVIRQWRLAGAVWLILAVVGFYLGLVRMHGAPRVPLRADSFQTAELFGPGRISQTVPLGTGGFNAIGFRAGPAGEQTQGQVILSLFERRGDVDERLLYETRVPASEIVAAPSYRFAFPPIEDSRGRMYRLQLRLPDAERGQGIVLWASDGRWTDGGSLFIGDESAYAELVFDVGVASSTLWSGLLERARSGNQRRPGMLVLALMFIAANAAFVLVCRAIETNREAVLPSHES